MSVRRFLGRRVSVKLTLIIGVVSLLGLTAMVLIASNDVTREVRDSTERYQQQVALQTAAQVRATLDEALDTATSLSTTLSRLVASGITDRRAFDSMLHGLLDEHPSLLGIYTGWEPDALDGRDADFAGTVGSDDTGRYIPYWNRAGGEVSLEALVDYTTPGVGDWYILPVTTGKTYVIEPFVYPVGGVDVLMTSLVTPVTIDDEDKATLLTWLNAGAPAEPDAGCQADVDASIDAASEDTQ